MRYVSNAVAHRTSRSSLAVLPVTIAPKRTYSVEAFSELINTRLQRLEGTREARQRYGGLLAVLRQQVDSYRLSRPTDK